ncbi:endo-arabinase [Blastomyces dermatitidis ATCC 18188]|uniref:Endo-arabinase n=1 Tax=Ajellomyces dermatitidis (strain ATCC 18188 / CBS 674.68) TaxID=653446 RepID=F2T4J2_AJEDA|nr:endo-arabinase [Blastomyces dermatitidis ATCC 18188]
MRSLLQSLLSVLSLAYTINAVNTTLFQGRFAKPGPHQVIPKDFPDPAILKVGADWYAFGTNAYNKKVQVAKSSDFEKWAVLNTDALASLGPWEIPRDQWAPHVIVRDDGKLVLYYSGVPKEFPRHHYVAAAISEGKNPAGPYHPLDEPFARHIETGGSIDPAGFLDKDGSRWVVYKVDGNSIGNGGDCGNSIPPIVPTTIYLQRVEGDGVTKVGDPTTILDRDESDGPLIEAPSLIRSSEGVYFLFYSSHCWTSPAYDVRYATSRSIRGPYVKAAKPLIKSGDYGLKAPGGATVADNGERILFHANCPAGRCMYAADLEIKGKTARIA